MDDSQEEATNRFKFNDWESLPSTHNHNHRNNHNRSSSHHPLPLRTTHHHHQHLSVFPPINHEDLPIPPPPPPPPHAPLTLSNFTSDSDSPSPSSPPPPKPRNSLLINKWVDFVLHLWNSKLRSCLAIVCSRGFFSLVFPAASTVWVLVFLWFWVRRRRQRLRRDGGKESVEHLKVLIKEKDEIIQLLEQIALMNKVLLARYKIPVIKSS
ncbi:formin-like protein 2 isoform X2 [Chenopodium quinoa]|uniref:formin-like protein 2 isoform X2 n=1 Tax=Chenopodium quinoa TaxID=63459 RepID=UPI000B78D55E|nr:formin-like protein 2 isoform X2 [Chenopodium quinoa]